LIKEGSTGSSADLSIRLQVSRRSVQDYLDELRILGAQILYDSIHRTYYYVNKFDIKYHLDIIVGEKENK